MTERRRSRPDAEVDAGLRFLRGKGKSTTQCAVLLGVCTRRITQRMHALGLPRLKRPPPSVAAREKLRRAQQKHDPNPLLDWWRMGKSGPAISDRFGIPARVVHRIIRTARKNGDARAVFRGRGG